MITNIAEHIRYFGTTTSPRAPALPVVEASVVGDLVVDAIVDDRFLVLTPPEVEDEIATRGQDIDVCVRSKSRSAE